MSVKVKPGLPSKKERRAIDLDTKMKVIDWYEGGRNVNSIARELRLSHSTISTILKNKVRIREAVKGSAPLRSTVITKKRTGPIHEMEKLLHLWMEDQVQKQTPPSLSTVQSKARSLFQALKERAGESYTQEFAASTGWFKRFKKRFQHQGVRAEIEANEEVAKRFVSRLEELILQEGYRPEQIFNVDETELFWRRMPGCTDDQVDGESEDRVTLLLGGNAFGSKLKPLLVYNSEQPRPFTNISKHTLPLQVRSSLDGRITPSLFEDWFLNCFVPEARECCMDRRVSFKILLIVDSAQGHPAHLDDLHPYVKVVYLPPNAAPLIQPMDQGAIPVFKANYLRETFAEAAANIVPHQEMSLRQFWDDYNIIKCIKNIETAWEGVPKQCMNEIWKKCVKCYVKTCDGFDSERELEAITDDVIKLAQELCIFCEVEDILEFLGHESEVSSHESVTVKREKAADEEGKHVEKEFTVKGLSDGFSLLSKLLSHFERMDPNVERFMRIQQVVQDAFRAYREIYEERKKRTKHPSTLRPVSLPAVSDGQLPGTSNQ